MTIYGDENSVAMSRHKIIPTTPVPGTYDDHTSYYTLTELEASDCLSTYMSQLSILYLDAIEYPLYLSKAGWLYVHFYGPATFSIDFSVSVDPAVYNQWWDAYVKTEAGWNLYIEGVETYTPLPSVDPTDRSYTSLYQNPIDYYYDTIDNERAFVTLTGFKDQNDVTDPIVVCGIEESTCTDAIKSTVFNLRGCYDDSLVAKFRVFIPPGTSSIGLLSHVYQSETSTPYRYIAVARLGVPPLNPSNTSVGSTAGFTLAQLRSADCVAGNIAGYLNIAIDSSPSIQSEDDGGWLYVNYFVVSGPTDIGDIVMSHSVNVGEIGVVGSYLHWYATQALFGSDGDPIVAEGGGVDPGETDEGVLTALPTSLTFGFVDVSETSLPKTITITNGTDASKTITISSPSGFTADWAGGTLASLASRSVNVVFSPIADQAYSGYLTFNDGETTARVYLSGTATTELPGEDTDSGRRKSNPFLVYGQSGDMYLFYDFVTSLKEDGSEITNLYYATSSDHGTNWSVPIPITSSENPGTSNRHPYAAIDVSGEITLAYTQQVSSLHADQFTVGWCGYEGGGKPIDLHFDGSTGKLYAVVARIDSGIHFLASIIVIDTVNWIIEKCYSSASSPAFNTYWNSRLISPGRTQGGGQYATVGSERYALVINHETETIVQYNFEENGTFTLTKNIDADWRGHLPSIIGTHIDAGESRLYITWYHAYASFTAIFFGYIDLTETPDAAIGKYTWNEIFYSPGIVDGYTSPGTSTVVKDADIVMITINGIWSLGTEGVLLIYSLSGGGLIKKYCMADYPAFPKWDIYSPVYCDGHIYAHFTYELNYNQSDKRGLLDINMSNDSMSYIVPTYAAGINDFALNRKVSTGDGRLIITTAGYGIQIFDIATGIWKTYDNAEIPGLTTTGSDWFEDVEYDSATGNIFSCSGMGQWYGIIMFNESGSYLQTKYRKGTFIDGDFGDESALTIGVMDYEMAVLKDSSDTLWGVWTRDDGGELSLKWDKDLSVVDLRQYLTGTATITWDIESTGKFEFSVSMGHLFDQYNLQSTLNPVLEKGRKITVEIGDIISGVDTWQNQGAFVLVEKSMTYTKGEHPIMSVRCEDARSMWDQATITATDYYSEQYPEAILYDLLTSHANMPEEMIDLPSTGSITGSHTIDHQWIDTRLMDCIRDITDHWGYFPYFNSDGIFTIRKINMSADAAHIYSDSDAMVGFSPDDAYGSFTNQVVIKGEGRGFIEVTYAEEMITSDSGTLGWWGCSETRRYYFSEDQQRRCSNPRIVVLQSPSINILFVEKGGGEISLLYVDPDRYFIDVYIAAPDLIMVVVASIAALITMAAISMMCVLDCGYYIFACMMLVSVVFYLLAAVANYSFEIYAFPIGAEKQTFQAQADDMDSQRKIGFIAKTETEDPFCYDVATCQLVADREMQVVMAQRRRITFKKIAHLQDEIGDILQIVHPYSTQAMNVYVTSISRAYSKPDGMADGGLIDSIEGWVL
jgi:hypothetical protein